MSREELLKELKSLDSRADPESNHLSADEALLEYINDPEITKAFESIRKLYS